MRSDPDKIRAWQQRSRTDLTKRPAEPGSSSTLRRTAPKHGRRQISPASTEQREKVASEACVVCARDRYDVRIDPAHLWPRGRGGCDHHLCVLPLCAEHHRAYDDGKLDMLTLVVTDWPRYKPEFDHATSHADPVSVMQRLAGAKLSWRPRETVPHEVFEGIDFEAFNDRVSEYRELTRDHGFDAALSHHAGEPVATPEITHGEDGHPLPDTSDIVLRHVPVEEDDEELQF